MNEQQIIDEIRLDIRRLSIVVEQLRGAVFGNPGSTRLAAGRVVPPADLGPAIAALSPEAQEYLTARIAGRSIQPADIVAAADWWQMQQEVRNA